MSARILVGCREWVAVAVIVSSVAACAPRSSIPAARREGVEGIERGSESRDDQTAQSPDTTGRTDEKLLESGALDGARPTDLDDASVDLPADPAPMRRVGAGSLELDAVTGFRSDSRLRYEDRRGFSAGARLDERGFIGFLRVDGKGVLKTIHVGRVTVRGGERLVLGRGMGSYATAGLGPVRAGFAASPSFSRWYGYPGSAVEIGWRRWRLCGVALGPSAGEMAFRPMSLWTSVLHDRDRGSVGVTLGQPLGPAAAGVAPEAARGEGPRVVSVFASYRGRSIESSGEAAGIEGGKVFFAARVVGRTRAPRSRWSALFFRAPRESPLGGSGLEPVGRTDQGTTLELSRSFGAIGLSAVLVAGRTRSERCQTSYRRLSLVLSERGAAPVWWETSVVHKDGCEEAFPTNPVDIEFTRERTSDLRLRASVGIRDGRSLCSSVRVDVLPGHVGNRGVVIVLSTELVGERVDGRLQVAAHSLPPGRPAFLWRPGVGAYECFAPLYGDGSDVAFRGGFRLTGGARVLVFYGSSWSGAARVYLGLEYRR